MNTFNNDYEEKYFKKEYDTGGITLQIPDIKINPPFQRSRTGNQEKRDTLAEEDDEEEEKNSIHGSRSFLAAGDVDPQSLINLNKNNLFAFSNESQLAQYFCDPNSHDQLSKLNLSNSQKRSSQNFSDQPNKSIFLSIPSIPDVRHGCQESSEFYNRQNSHNSKQSSASMIKSHEDSDDSFTSINTDIQNTIINEQQHQHSGGEMTKLMNAYGRQGTYGHRKDDKNLLTINVIEDNSGSTQTQLNPSANPFTRSLTSRTQYNIKQDDHPYSNSNHNIDEESLYTEEDQIESQSRDAEEFTRGCSFMRSRTLREDCNQKDANKSYLSPIKLTNKNTSFNTGSAQESIHLNTSSHQIPQIPGSPRSWGGIPNSPLAGTSPWQFSPQRQNPQYPPYMQQQTLPIPSISNNFLQAPPNQFRQTYYNPPPPIQQQQLFQQQPQYLQAPVYYPNMQQQQRSQQMNPYFLNPNSNMYERQKSSISNSTNSSHASSKSKSSMNKSLLMLNQGYKSLQTDQEKLEFLLRNAGLMAKDQNGCRRIQKKLDEQSDRENHKFCEDMLNSLIETIDDLMLDSFANYLCQKLIKTAKPYQVDMILKKANFVRIALNRHGTRVLQNLLNQISPLNDFRSQVISESFKDSVLELSINIHGNHVIQICLDNFANEDHKSCIYQTVLKHCAQIATDKHGCCVIQKLLSSPTFKIQDELIQKSITQIDLLINNQFGNYVVQQVLKFNNPSINLQIANFICDKFLYFCTQKISSNVVENAIRGTSNECQKIFFNYLMKNSGIFKDIMMDQFGNYVIQAIFQKAFDFQDQTYFNQFYLIFEESLEELKKVSFGKKFIQKISDHQVPIKKSNQCQFKRQHNIRQENIASSATFRSDPQGTSTAFKQHQQSQNSGGGNQGGQKHVKFTKKKTK